MYEYEYHFHLPLCCFSVAFPVAVCCCGHRVPCGVLLSPLIEMLSALMDLTISPWLPLFVSITEI